MQQFEVSLCFLNNVAFKAKYAVTLNTDLISCCLNEPH